MARERPVRGSVPAEIDVASQDTTEDEALQNLREALELHFEPPRATATLLVKTIKVEVGAA